MTDSDAKDLTGLERPATPPPVPQPRPSRSTTLTKIADAVKKADENVQTAVQMRSPGLNIVITVAHVAVAGAFFFGLTKVVKAQWWLDSMAVASPLSAKVIALIAAGGLFVAGCMSLSQTVTQAAFSTIGNLAGKLVPFARRGDG
jgi:hypothetical protein